MRDHVTNQPQPSTPDPPARPRLEPDEDHPPRPNRLTIWSPRSVTHVIGVGVGIGVVLMSAGGLVGEALGRVRTLFMIVGFLVGATIGVLSMLGSLKRQIGIGIRTSNRDLPRGAIDLPGRPKRPPLPDTGII